jgi:hypothetical protein
MAVAGAANPQQAPTHKQSVLTARTSKDKEFAESRTSPMSGVDRNSFPLGSTVWLGSYGTGYAFGEKRPEGTIYRLAAKDHMWEWASVDGKEKGAITFGREFRMGSLTVLAYPYPEELTLICFDAARPEQKAFHGLKYFPYDSRYAVSAKLRLYPQPEKVTLATSRQLEKTFYRSAEITFTLAGKPCRLAAFKSELTGPAADTLFIPFTDLTTGKQSYAAGRFIEIPDPRTTDFTLDFNEAFNPLCNYADTYNCPRPPKENALPVAIKAGEMTYGSGKH